MVMTALNQMQVFTLFVTHKFSYLANKAMNFFEHKIKLVKSVFAIKSYQCN